MRRISAATVLAMVFITWPRISYGCDDGTIGPCAPARPESESALGMRNLDEPTGSKQIFDTVRSLGTQAIDDTAYILTSPLRIDRKSALIVGGVAAGIGGLMVADKTTQRAFQENRTDTTDEIAKTFETIGFSRTVLGANVALIGAGWLFRQHEEGNKLMRTALVSLEAELLTEGIAGLTKFTVGRAWPGARRGASSHTSTISKACSPSRQTRASRSTRFESLPVSGSGDGSDERHVYQTDADR